MPEEPEPLEQQSLESQEETAAFPPEEFIPNEESLMELQAQVTEFREKYLRGLADSENQRKRLQKERQELVQYAVQSALTDFLSPLDHLENALKFADQAAPEVKHWAVGFQMIVTQFKEALLNNGIQAFESVGKPFDPHCHEAIEMVITDEFSPGTVVEESIRGYKLGDKIIRPARVKVAKSPPKEDIGDFMADEEADNEEL